MRIVCQGEAEDDELHFTNQKRMSTGPLFSTRKSERFFFKYLSKDIFLLMTTNFESFFVLIA